MEKNSVYCPEGFCAEKLKGLCRLCAKSDGEYVNLMPGQYGSLSENDYKCDMDLSNAILDFFRINVKENEQLSQIICTDCHGVIFSFMIFSERVKKVQLMYDDIQITLKQSPSNLRMLLEKYGLYKDEPLIPQRDIDLPAEEIFVADLAYTITADSKEIDVKNEETTAEHPNDTIENNDIISDSIDAEDDFENESSPSWEDVFNSDTDNMSLAELKDTQATSIDDVTAMEDISKSNICCNICSQSFQRRSNYSVHMKNKHALLLCRRCPNSFKTQFSLKQHMKEHQKLFTCLHCDQRFERKGLASNHMKTEHKDKTSFVCETCGKAVRTEKKLNKHMLVHSDSRLFSCEECGKSFKEKPVLKRHLKMHIAKQHAEKEQKTFDCDMCSEILPSKKELSKHMLTHSSDTKFVCKVCGKNFKDKAILRGHLEIHGEKHICPECGIQLSCRANYNRHMKVHSNKMPHKCEFCGRPFKRSRALKYHLIAHMGLRPYSCDFCDKTFSTGSSCRFHKKTMHPVELAELEATGATTYTKNIPSIEELKAAARTNKNWVPLKSKQEGYQHAKYIPEPEETNDIKI